MIAIARAAFPVGSTEQTEGRLVPSGPSAGRTCFLPLSYSVGGPGERSDKSVNGQTMRRLLISICRDAWKAKLVLSRRQENFDSDVDGFRLVVAGGSLGGRLLRHPGRDVAPSRAPPGRFRTTVSVRRSSNT